jgi:hypothetical protein
LDEMHENRTCSIPRGAGLCRIGDATNAQKKTTTRENASIQRLR